MFFGIVILRFFILFFYLWGDYIKILIFLEIISLFFIFILLFYMKLEYFGLNYFFLCLVFLVCEARLGFLLFILYVSIENEVVKKIILIQF